MPAARAGARLAVRAAAAAAAGARGQVSARISVKTLANGLQVIAVSHHEQPAVSLRLIVRAGGAQDPADKPGVAALAAALLDQGTTTEERRADRHARSIRSAARSAPGAGSDLTFINAVGHEGQPGLRAATWCPMSRGIRRSRPRRSSGSGSRCCRG